MFLFLIDLPKSYELFRSNSLVKNIEEQAKKVWFDLDKHNMCAVGNEIKLRYDAPQPI